MHNFSADSYFVIEGIDGSGKTTQTELFADTMKSLDYEVEVISEPGGTEIGDKLRTIIKDASLERTPESNLDLFNVSRREIVVQKIGPALIDGKIVVSDRNWLSSVAYQGFGEGMDKDVIIQKARDALGDFFWPGDMVVIDVPLEIAEERIRNRPNGNDYFEQKGSQFFERVLNGYRWLTEKYEIKTVDGSNEINQVKNDIDSALNL